MTQMRAPIVAPPSPLVTTDEDLRPGVTRRALLLAGLLIVLTALVTPYNDEVLGNTPFVGNFLPIGVLSLLTLLVLVVNPLLQVAYARRPRAWRRPLQEGELIVIAVLLLVAAAVPSSGLMRYLEPTLLGAVYQVPQFPWLRPLVDLLPAWAVPTHESTSPLIMNYMLGPERGTMFPTPWLVFIVPALAWGVLIVALLGAMLCVAGIFRRQWVFHERLSYPLATIPLEMLGAPERGRHYNRLWRNSLLWVGAGIPLTMYLLSGLQTYIQAMPYVSLTFDFRSAFTEAPWDQMPTYLTANRIYLSVVGLCFFVPSEVALSLWVFVLVAGFSRVLLAPTSIDLQATAPARDMGIYLAYFAGLVYLARWHLARVLVAAWRNTPREAGEFARYRTLAGGLLLALATAWLWMLLFGIDPMTAALTLGLGFVLLTLMARIVAETGLFFLGTSWQVTQFFGTLLGPGLVSMNSHYLAGVVSKIFFGDLRENLLPFATNSLAIGGKIQEQNRPRLFRWMFAAVLLSAVVAGVANHGQSYTYGRTVLRDGHATYTVPMLTMTDAYNYAHGQTHVTRPTAWAHFGIGVGLVGALLFARTMWAGWPLHPMGLLLLNTWPLQVFWFSILVGWFIKAVMLRYGGALVFRRARPFFIGLIIGEVLAAGGWMLAGLLTGGAIRYQLLPG